MSQEDSHTLTHLFSSLSLSRSSQWTDEQPVGPGLGYTTSTGKHTSPLLCSAVLTPRRRLGSCLLTGFYQFSGRTASL